MLTVDRQQSRSGRRCCLLPAEWIGIPPNPATTTRQLMISIVVGVVAPAHELVVETRALSEIVYDTAAKQLCWESRRSTSPAVELPKRHALTSSTGCSVIDHLQAYKTTNCRTRHFRCRSREGQGIPKPERQKCVTRAAKGSTRTAQQVQTLVTFRGPQSSQSWPRGHQFVTAFSHAYWLPEGSAQ